MIPRMEFGRTGHFSTRTIFGAVALADVNQKTADETLELLFKYGVNHIDVAMSYGDAELRVGPWMKQYRNEFFLATKTGKRTYSEAMKELHQSLERLQADQIDLWQMHALTDKNEWEIAMGPGGALEAFIEAKEKGLVKYIGVTGHGYHMPKLHMQSLVKYNFDSVLLPYNYLMNSNPEYAKDFDMLLSLCAESKTAVQTIKSITKGPWNQDKKTSPTWYKPLTNPSEIEAAVFYSLNRPGIFMNTVGDVNLLPFVLKAADLFEERRNEYKPEEILSRINFESLF